MDGNITVCGREIGVGGARRCRPQCTWSRSRSGLDKASQAAVASPLQCRFNVADTLNQAAKASSTVALEESCRNIEAALPDHADTQGEEDLGQIGERERHGVKVDVPVIKNIASRKRTGVCRRVPDTPSSLWYYTAVGRLERGGGTATRNESGLSERPKNRLHEIDCPGGVRAPYRYGSRSCLTTPPHAAARCLTPIRGPTHETDLTCAITSSRAERAVDHIIGF